MSDRRVCAARRAAGEMKDEGAFTFVRTAAPAKELRAAFARARS